MSYKTAQRDLFLVLTIVGSFICTILVLLGGVYLLKVRRQITSDLAAGNLNGLLNHFQSIGPISFGGGLVFLATFFSYRRYQRLIVPNRD